MIMASEITQWIMGIVAALLAAGVAGVWRLGTSVAALEARVSGWTSTFEQRFVVVTDVQSDHTKRLAHLETRTELHEERLRRGRTDG